MNKYFLLVSVFFTLNSLVAQTDLVRYLPDNSPDRIMMSLPGNPANSFGLSWRTNINITKSIGEIAAANPSPEFEKTIKQVKGSHALWEEESNLAMGHKIIFSDLVPNTKYVYRIGDGINWSEWVQYKTAYDKAAPFSFIYFGDLQHNIKKYCTKVLQQASSHQPNAAFMLFAGDLIGKSTEKDWGEFFYAGGHSFRRTPSIASPGNHEYYKAPPGSNLGEFSRQWNQIYINPDNGPDSQKNLAFYIDYQGARIISLESTQIMKGQAVNEQLEWFENVLKNNTQKWTIVTFHHPVYSCFVDEKNKSMQEKVKPLLEKYGVDLVLQGHNHNYCRGLHLDSIGKECKNPPMYVVSTVGSKKYGQGFPNKNNSTQFYQIIDVNDNMLTFNAYTENGDLYDSFQLKKSGNGPNTLIVNSIMNETNQHVLIRENAIEKYSKEDKERYLKIYNYKIIDKE